MIDVSTRYCCILVPSFSVITIKYNLQILQSGPISWKIGRTLEINHLILKWEVGSRMSVLRFRRLLKKPSILFALSCFHPDDTDRNVSTNEFFFYFYDDKTVTYKLPSSEGIS